jgi:hypothetical protein
MAEREIEVDGQKDGQTLSKSFFLICKEFLNARESGFQSKDSIQLAQDEIRLEIYQHGNKPADSIEAGNSFAKSIYILSTR